MSTEQPPQNETRSEAATSDQEQGQSQEQNIKPKDEPPKPPEKEKAPRRIKSRNISSLKCWPEVMAMIEDGFQITQIVQFIQDSGELPDTPAHNISCSLYYWISKNSDRYDLRGRSTSCIQMMAAADQVDPFQALNMLLQLQVERVSRHFEAEKRHNNFTNFNTNAIRLATDIAAKMADIELKRRPKAQSEPKNVTDSIAQTERMTKFFAEKYGSDVATVMADSQSRARVMSLIERGRRMESPAFKKILADNKIKAEELRRQEEEETRLDIQDEHQIIDIDGKVTE